MVGKRDFRIDGARPGPFGEAGMKLRQLVDVHPDRLNDISNHGVGQRFHHTLTVAWVRIIEAARREHPALPFDALAAACPYLLDKDAPLEYYTREHLFSDDARQGWVEPDLKSLPSV